MISVRAPGKAIVCGEYAVLDGAPAISIAVDRFVVATEGRGMRSPFVEAAARHAAAALKTTPMTDIAVDSSALYDPAGKIGVGSSAAVTAAVVGLAFVKAGRSLDDKAQLFAVADAAHAEAQGVAGSGIDVATSVYGGAIRFERAPGIAPIITPVAWPTGLFAKFYFSGASASTPELVGRVKRLRERDPAVYAKCMGALAAIARDFADALGANDAARAVSVAARWTPALAELGRAADAPIVTPFFESLSRTAILNGQAAKPSGAGGGDLAIALGTGDIDTLARSLSRDGVSPLDMRGPALGLSVLNHLENQS